MATELQLLSDELLAARFPYDKLLVAEIRALGRRKWDPAGKLWRVHLSHLPDLERILGLKPEQVPAEARKLFEERYAGAKVEVRLDGLRGSLSGNAAIPVGRIDQETSFAIQGAQYSELFQSGRWDGRKRLFDAQRLTFPAGLWERIRRVLEDEKVEYEIVEAPEPPKSAGKALKSSAPKTALRDYQAEALKSALKADRGVLQIATGGGKTLLATHLIHNVGQPTYFFVHTRELLHQARGVFARELGVEIGILGDGQVDPRPITVATIQTAARALGIGGERSAEKPAGKPTDKPKAKGGAKGRVKARGSEEDAEDIERPTAIEERREEICSGIAGAGMIIFDECHHVPADTFYKIAMKARGAVRRYGLSATPWRDDGQDLLLEAALGPTIAKASLSDLIHSGYLIAPRIIMRRAPGPRGLRRRTPYAEIRQAAIVENHGRNRVIAAQAREWADQGRSVLILVGQIEHGEALLDLLPDAQFAHGRLETDERRRMMDELERKLRPILIATTLADEGLDIPSLDSLILAGGGRSPTRAYQRIGRALRLWPGKTDALALDFYDDAPYLAEHSMERLRLYQYEAGFQIQTEGFRIQGLA